MHSIYFREEHHQFRQNLRAFFEKEIDAKKWEKEKRIPREIWEKMGELGYLGIDFPEKYGGSAADFFYSVAFLEEVGRVGLGGFAAAVGVQQYMATAHIYKFGSETLKRKYLVPSIEGSSVGALAVSEPDAGSDVSAIRTRAVRDGDHYVVDGEKTFITNGVYGDFVTVAVRTGPDRGSGGISLLVVDRNAPGLTASPLAKLGWHCSDTATLTFEAVKVPAANLVGRENKGFYYIMECFQLERLVAALTAIGGADYCLETTLSHIRSRQAFGKPIARFQVVRHQIVDMLTELEAVKQLTYHACWLHGQGTMAVKECSMAKLKASELGKEIADRCLQFFGGYGFMEEYPIAAMYRDARAGTIVGGTSEIMKEIVAKVVIDEKRYVAPSTASGHPDAGDGESDKEMEAPSVAEIFNTLPARYRGKSDLSLRVHFDFGGDGKGAYTVTLEDGACAVTQGLEGEADCRVTAPGATYRDIELGRLTPEAAFMTGQIQVTDIPAMMDFVQSFRKLSEP